MIWAQFSRRAAFAALAGMLAVTMPAQADDDHERARDALRSGEVLPLSEILQRLGDSLGGSIIEMEFDREDGRYVYEFEVVTPQGQVQEVYVDAETAEILTREDD